MKITSTKRTTLTLLLLGANLLIQLPVRADVGIGEVIGTAWTIGDAIIGETTLTPAYAVKSWYQRSVVKTPYQFGNNDVTRKLRRDKLGVYFYDTKIVITPAWAFPNPTENSNPFPVDSMNKLNMTCYDHGIDPQSGAPYTVTRITVETHTEVVWLEKVERTGLWPDNGPWTVWLKTGGHRTGCGGALPTSNPYYWVPASVSLGGDPVTVSLGNPNCILNYPFYLASEFYK